MYPRNKREVHDWSDGGRRGVGVPGGRLGGSPPSDSHSHGPDDHGPEQFRNGDVPDKWGADAIHEHRDGTDDNGRADDDRPSEPAGQVSTEAQPD